MTDPASKVLAAYAELVLAAADARSDTATESFDATVASAVAGGQLDEQLARTLRRWQRESVRDLRDHLAETLPPLFEALAARSLRTTASMDAPDDTTHADNNYGSAIDAPRRDATRTVLRSVGARRPPARRTEQRRRVLVASLIAATDPATNTRQERGEGRR